MSDQESQEDQQQDQSPEPGPQAVFDSGDTKWWDGGTKKEAGEEFKTQSFITPLDKMTRRKSGRRSRTRTERKRGRYIMARRVTGKTSDIAFDATLRAAAPYQRERRTPQSTQAFSIRKSDLHRKIRVKKTANLILFVVDASWSMAVAERMAATKGAILSLLSEAYQRRDRVGLVVFQKNRGTLILPPTNSVLLARQALADIPVGGKTPLSSGMQLAHNVIRQEKIARPDVLPLLILLTDGAGNVSMGKASPMEEAHMIADQIMMDKIRCVVINMEHEAFDQGLAQAIADHLNAPCHTFSELRAESLYQAVRFEINRADAL